MGILTPDNTEVVAYGLCSHIYNLVKEGKFDTDKKERAHLLGLENPREFKNTKGGMDMITSMLICQHCMTMYLGSGLLPKIAGTDYAFKTLDNEEDQAKLKKHKKAKEKLLSTLETE